MLEALGTDGDRSLHHHGNLRVCKRSPVTMLCKELDQAEVLDTDDAVPDHVIPCRLCLQCPVTIHLPCLVVPAVVVRNVLPATYQLSLAKETRAAPTTKRSSPMWVLYLGCIYSSCSMVIFNCFLPNWTLFY